MSYVHRPPKIQWYLMLCVTLTRIGKDVMVKTTDIYASAIVMKLTGTLYMLNRWSTQSHTRHKRHAQQVFCDLDLDLQWVEITQSTTHFRGARTHRRTDEWTHRQTDAWAWHTMIFIPRIHSIQVLIWYNNHTDYKQSCVRTVVFQYNWCLPHFCKLKYDINRVTHKYPHVVFM